SRIEAGKLKLFETAVDLGNAAQATVRLVTERAADSGVRVTTEVEKDLPTLWGDERLVKQILINLLANAVKFTPRGGSVAVRAFKDQDGRLGLSVTDTGIGIAETDLLRVMEPFGQADGSLRRRYEGTGLGLPLVRSFVELHGAAFDLKSQVGSGTTATVMFPVERTMLRSAVPVDEATRRIESTNVTALRSAASHRAHAGPVRGGLAPLHQDDFVVGVLEGHAVAVEDAHPHERVAAGVGVGHEHDGDALDHVAMVEAAQFERAQEAALAHGDAVGRLDAD